MSIINALLGTSAMVFLFVITIVAANQNTCPVVRYSGSYSSKDHVGNHALLGKSYKNLTVTTLQECFSVCVQDCRCVSYQLNATRCELIDENRHTAPRGVSNGCLVTCTLNSSNNSRYCVNHKKVDTIHKRI